jgi:hypothetical protein
MISGSNMAPGMVMTPTAAAPLEGAASPEGPARIIWRVLFGLIKNPVLSIMRERIRGIREQREAAV